MKTTGIDNVVVECGHLDNLNFPDNFFDVVASNGIYNLSPDKEKVIREVHRVLKAGGRTVFCEIVLKERLDLRTLRLYQKLEMPAPAISWQSVPIFALIRYKEKRTKQSF